MDRLNELKEKWSRRVAEDRGGERFDYDFLAPGSFCLHLADGLGEGPCSSAVEVTGFFESPDDALAYLLVVQIPHILDWDSGVRGEHDRPLEEYMGCYSGEKRAAIEQLIGLIESAARMGRRMRRRWGGSGRCSMPALSARSR